MGSVERRGENSWRVSIRLPTSEGRRWVRKTFTYPPSVPEDEQQRLTRIEQLRMELAIAEGRDPLQDAGTDTRAAAAAPAGSDEDYPPITVQELYDRWMIDHCEPHLKPTTTATYRNLMETRILPALGHRIVLELKPIELQRFINGLKTSARRDTSIPPEQRKNRADRQRPPRAPKPLSPRTVQHYYDVLAYMFGQGVTWELIPRNPMDKVQRPKAQKKRMKVLDDQEAVALLRCLAGEKSLPFRAAVMLGLLCGLRLGEVTALRMEDINWEDCSMDVSRAVSYTSDSGSVVGTPKSDAGNRIIALPAGMMTLLHSIREEAEENAAALGDRWKGEGLIVCSWDGSPVHHDTPSRWWRNFADANGYAGIRFHDLRHTHATLLLANNIDAVAVAARMGHASPDTTYRYYAHAIRKRDLESAQVMQKILEAADGPEE